MKRTIVLTLLSLSAVLYGLVGFGVFQPTVCRAHGVQGGTIRIQGADLRYIQAGQGDDVLLIHGCPGMIEDWDALIPYLAKRFRVTSYDRPGSGYSGGWGLGYSLESNAEAAFRLMDRLGMGKPVILVGHSYGAAVALKMALERPDRVKALVLIGVSPYAGTEWPSEVRLIANPAFGPVLAALDSLLNGSKTIEGVVRGLFTPDGLPENFLDAWKTPYSRPWPKMAMCRELQRYNLDVEAMEPRYQTIKTPMTVVMGGNDDERVPAERFYETVPNSKFVLFEGRGHYAHVVEPRRTADLVR